jgi:malate dehydrogenase
MRTKISIIGAGMVGGHAAYEIVRRELGDVVLIDLIGDLAKGKALDIAEARPVLNSHVNIMGGADYNLTKNSDVIVIVAGVARKPGMTREQLVGTNAKIVADVTKKIMKHSPKAIVVVVTNPLDAMAWVVKKVSGLSRERVIGMAGILDSARFQHFLAEAADVSVEDVQVLVMGSHGEAMVPMERYALINGVSALDILGKKKMAALVKRTREGGAEIVKLLKKGSAYYAPGCSVAELVESIVRDQKKVLSCSIYTKGEYGVKDMFVGVPVVIGRKGIEKVIEIPMNGDEKKRFKAAVKSIKRMIEQAKKSL